MAEPAGNELPGSELHSSLERLVQETKTLNATYHQAEAVRRRKTSVMIAILAGLVVVVLVALILVYRVTRVANQIDSCTNPEGQCYLDQRRQTGGAITRILHGQIVTEECARVSKSDAELEACVAERMAPTTAPTKP